MMHREVKLVAPEGVNQALLTTEHSAASYGMPVLVVDGNPHGPADLSPGAVIEVPGYISAEEYGRIRMAGYRNVRARIRVALDLDADTWLEISAQAAREAREKRDVVEQALRQYLQSANR